MGLSIPEDQQQTCYELAQPLYLHFALANDYHSWERDLKVASDSSQPFVANAIWILMNKHSMTCDEAKAACCERASQYAAEYEQAVEATKRRDDLCQDAKLLLERLKLAICGNNVGALQRYCYPADRKPNATQVKMVEAPGVKEKTMDLELDKQRFVDEAVKPLKAKTNGAFLNGAVAKEALANGTVTKNAFRGADLIPSESVFTNTGTSNTEGLLINGLTNVALPNGSSPLRNLPVAAVRDIPSLSTKASAPLRRVFLRSCSDQMIDQIDRSLKHHRAILTRCLERASVTTPSWR